MRDWRKETENCFRMCHKCGEKIEANKERYVSKPKGSVLARFYHLDCGEEFQKNHELEIKQEVSECLSELRQLWDDLEPKVENEDLNVTDCQRIYALKSKINTLLKTPNTEDFLTYWEVKIDFDTLRKSLTDLDNFLNECASPQTQDKVSSDKNRNRKANKTCSHENIEPYEDDPSNYCCAYCWDGKSESFLQALAKKGLKPGENKPNQQTIKELKTKIKDLKNKINRTSQEEAELADKQTQLTNLTNKEPTNNNSWLTPPLLIGGTIIMAMVIIYLVNKKNNTN